MQYLSICRRIHLSIFTLLTLSTLFPTLGIAQANESSVLINPINSIYIESFDIDLLEESINVVGTITNVHFRAQNITDHAISTSIKIPLPTYVPGDTDIENSFNNLDTFFVQVNRSRIEAIIDYKAFIGERDCTKDLIDAGIDLSNYSSYKTKIYEQLPVSNRDLMLYNKKLVDINEISQADGGSKVLLVPRWVVTPSFNWDQNFQANESIDISYTFSAKRRIENVEFSLSNLPDCNSPYEWYVYNKMVGRNAEDLLKISTVEYELMADSTAEHFFDEFRVYFAGQNQHTACMEYQDPSNRTISRFKHSFSYNKLFEHKGRLTIKFIE